MLLCWPSHSTGALNVAGQILYKSVTWADKCLLALSWSCILCDDGILREWWDMCCESLCSCRVVMILGRYVCFHRCSQFVLGASTLLEASLPLISCGLCNLITSRWNIALQPSFILFLCWKTIRSRYTFWSYDWIIAEKYNNSWTVLHGYWFQYHENLTSLKF